MILLESEWGNPSLAQDPQLINSQISQYPLLLIIAIWGIDGGVAKANADIIPITQIIDGKFIVVTILLNKVAQTALTKDAVTIFDDKLVWIAAQDANIINNNIGLTLVNELPKLFCKNNFSTLFVSR